MAKDMRDKRALVESWFAEIERPIGPDSRPTATVSDWIIEDEKYPGYEELSRWAIPDRSISDQVAKGTYAALCAFSHPSFVAARELRIIKDGRLIYGHDFSYVERLLRLALFGLGDAFKHWLGYYDHDHDRLVGRLDDIADRWETMSQPSALPGSSIS